MNKSFSPIFTPLNVSFLLKCGYYEIDHWFVRCVQDVDNVSISVYNLLDKQTRAQNTFYYDRNALSHDELVSRMVYDLNAETWSPVSYTVGGVDMQELIAEQQEQF